MDYTSKVNNGGQTTIPPYIVFELNFTPRPNYSFNRGLSIIIHVPTIIHAR